MKDLEARERARRAEELASATKAELTKEIVALRTAYDALFDFLADELGFTAKETSQWGIGLVAPWVYKNSPRQLGMTTCVPEIKRVKKARGTK